MHNKTHYIGLDLLKLLAFIILAGWHYVSVIWVDSYEYFPFSDTTTLWAAIEFWSRALSSSGQALLMISAFLTGMYGGKARSKWFYVFLIFGLLAFSLMEKKDPEEAFLEWDVYALVFVGFLFHSPILKLNKIQLIATTILGFILTWIPFNTFSFLTDLPKLVRQFLIGDCVHASAQWPILPWLFFLILFMSLGRFMRLHLESGFIRLKYWIGIVMALGLVLSFSNFYSYFENHSNEFTNCELFLIEPMQFWLQFIPIVIFAVLSLDVRVNGFLGQYFQAIRNFNISKNLWLLYFMQYLLIHIMSWTIGDWLRSGPYSCFVGYLLVWPASEVVTTLVSRQLKRF